MRFKPEDGGYKIVGKNLHKIVLVGTPNVGKSLLFNLLTGSYVHVSNYPGTTVEVTRGRTGIRGKMSEIIDTPGLYSFFPVSEEERVARHLLFNEGLSLILHVIDAKNIRRHLPMTLHLREAGFKVVLVVNMLDEAQKKGITVDTKSLSESLLIPVIPTVLTRRQGLRELKLAVLEVLGEGCGGLPPPVSPPAVYPPSVEEPVRRVSALLTGRYQISKRTVALLLLCGDEEVFHLVKRAERHGSYVLKEVNTLKEAFVSSPLYLVTTHLFLRAGEILQGVIMEVPRKKRGADLSSLTVEPLTGIPLLFLILYLGLYKFVGGFGAGYLVNILENQLFAAFLVPWANHMADMFLPGSLPKLFAHEYGLLTLGLRYAVAIVLPIVGTYFFFFSFLEDSGYLPRLALLSDGIFKKVGLSGRAVIPMTLGLGCGTMAVIVTRTLETRRERFIASFLLALAIPCSAQLGLFFGILSPFPWGLITWSGIIMLVFIAAGCLADVFLPGEKPAFYMEVPPLRIPSVSNIAAKTFSRMWWYFKEVLPIFLILSFLVALSQAIGLLQVLIEALTPFMELLGLPGEMAVVFLLGFLRRDYGAAGVYDLSAQGVLSPAALVVSAVTLTLFLPCLAQLAVLFRERGVVLTLVIVALVGCIAFLVGGLLHTLFLLMGV